MSSDVYTVTAYTVDGSLSTPVSGMAAALAHARTRTADPATMLVVVRDRRGILVFDSRREVRPIEVNQS